jgi:uncharacterized protein (TIGR02611 family)
MASVLSRAWRIVGSVGVAIVGFALLIAGVVMLITPGPGWVCIFAGLGILATEFVWARRILHKAKKTAVSARDKVIGRTNT